MHQLVHIGIAASKAAGDRHFRIDGVGGKLRLGQVDVRFHLCIPEAHNGKAGLVVVLALFANEFQQLRRAALLVAVPVLKVLLRKVAVLVQCFAAQQLDFLPGVGGQLHLHVASHVLPKVQHGLAARGAQQPARKGFLLPDGHGVHAGDGQGVRLGLYAMPTGKFPFQPGIVHLALLQIVLADGTLLGGLHTAVRNTDRLAVHFQLEQDSQFAAEQVTVTIHTGGAAVPAVAQCDKQFIFTVTDKRGHIVGLCPKVLIRSKAAGGKHHVADPLAVQPCRIQPPGSNVQPLAFSRRGGERFAQIACRAVGLIRLRLPFAGGFQRRLLLLPVGLCKGVDGIGAVDVRLFCFRADPHALPIRLRKTRFKLSFAPCAGLIVFIPQADAPLSLRLGRYSGGRFGVHPTAQNLSARPQRSGSGGHFNFVGSLAHTSGALPRQKQRPGIHAERRRKMVRFQICCLHHLHLLFPVDLCSYYKGNPTEYGCENLCCRSKSRVIYYNPKNSSCFTTFHPYCLRFSCYTLGKKIRGLRTALKRKEGITEWTLKRSSSR